MKPFLNYIFKEKNKVVLTLVFLFSYYCAVIVGQAWDEGFHLIQGKVVLDYLMSFGKIDKDILYRENYSAIYWTFSHFFTNFFPKSFELEASHLINTTVSIFTIIGIGKISQQIFDKKTGSITFLILFLFPIFFGHMAINSKDTILAFCHVWIFYSFIRYFKKQNTKRRNNYIFTIGILSAIGTGIQLVFLGSLLPLIAFFIIDIFYLKIFIRKDFKIQKLIIDLIKSFFIFYLLLIFFWIDAHENPLILPFKFLTETFSDTYWTGWPYSLINGEYITSTEVPASYLLKNFFYKTPEYLLILYFIFFFILFFKNKNLSLKYTNLNIKILFILFILIFPNLILLFIPYPLYDGLRLFLWVIPYCCIIPALTLNYLLEKIKYKISKVILSVLLISFINLVVVFFLLTPYQYTYLNIFAGKKNVAHQKFENDYWGASLKELVKKTNFETKKSISIYSCGINNGVLKKYMKKKYNNKFELVSEKSADYIFMTNRTISDANNNPTNCFEKYSGNNLFEVKRNGLLLSAVRKL